MNDHLYPSDFELLLLCYLTKRSYPASVGIFVKTKSSSPPNTDYFEDSTAAENLPKQEGLPAAFLGP